MTYGSHMTLYGTFYLIYPSYVSQTLNRDILLYMNENNTSEAQQQEVQFFIYSGYIQPHYCSAEAY